MTADWDLDTICAAFSNASLGGTNWSEALEVASSHVAGVGGTIVPLQGRFSQLPTTRSFAEAIDTYIRQDWAGRDVRFDGLARMRATGVVTDLDFISEEAIKRHAYYQEWLHPFGLRWFAGIHVAGAGEEWAISIQRSAGQEPFAAEEVERLKLLSQGISSAVAVANALGFARAEAALAAFDMSNRAVLVLDQRGHVTLMNASADRLFCGDVHLLGGRLFCRDASARKALDGAVHTVCAGASGAATLMPVRIPRQEAAPIVAYVTPARGVALDLFSKCRAFVILVDPLDRRVPSPELLQKVFPLTPTEARLAHFLTKGHKLHDLSAKGGFSYETGRNHLKSIFAKLGVNSQADLVAILVSIAAPLGLS